MWAIITMYLLLDNLRVLGSEKQSTGMEIQNSHYSFNMLGTSGKFLKCRPLSYLSIWVVTFLAVGEAHSHQKINLKFLRILSVITLKVLKVCGVVKFSWKSQNSLLHKTL